VVPRMMPMVGMLIDVPQIGTSHKQ
jgi:hypothetical protein